ncbi:hypothetical protein DFH08DRAFT_823917 [Mycena albidolilacea]|uniref:Uncharacterized protein n=1 Tax=Mycena albidolilacea TaxID=1033008 RepID=A0AAD6Z6I9_9AGAR|nr:hypothetical protein DFH08DRAFT_823917 [Mycena albidolilacea]
MGVGGKVEPLRQTYRIVGVQLDIAGELAVAAVEGTMKAVKESMEAWVDHEIKTSGHTKDLLTGHYDLEMDKDTSHLARFCEKAVEDPQHAAGTHMQLRGEFLKTLYNEVPSIRGQLTDPTSFFRSVLARRETTPLLAKLAFNVLKIYDATPMLFGRTPNDSPSIIFGGLLSMYSAKGRPATIVLVLVESEDFYLEGENFNRVPQGFNWMSRHSMAGQSAVARVLQCPPLE